MGFYASQPKTLLIVSDDGLAEKASKIEEIAGECRMTPCEGKQGFWLATFDGSWGEEWPGGDCHWGVDDDIDAVLALCEDGSYVQYFHEDDFMFVRANKEHGAVARRTSEPLPCWEIE